MMRTSSTNRAACLSTVPLLLLLVVVLTVMPVDAAITFMDSGKSFPSRPEQKLGHQLWQGSDYLGRLQFVHGNLQLCKSAQEPTRRFTIADSMDGLPSTFGRRKCLSCFAVVASHLCLFLFCSPSVAIYAKAGGCSLEEKALVASTLIDPPNVVGYLIVDDGERDRRLKEKTKKQRSSSLYSYFQWGAHDEEDDLLDDFIENPFWAETVDTDEDLGSLWEELMAQVHKQPPLPFEMQTLPTLAVDGGMDEEEGVEAVSSVESVVADDETAPPLPPDLIHHRLELPMKGDASANDYAPSTLPLERFRVWSGENAWWIGGDNPQSDDSESVKNRQLTGNGVSDRINVAILHVTNRVGYDLLDLLLKENSEVGRLGGPKVLLNSKEPNASARTIFVWTLISVSVSACACCCMLLCFEFVGEEEANAPQQPVRRRLTNNQVRAKFPTFHYHPENHVDQPLDDECAICLDDFTEGTRLRKLPCGHVFHSTCVARWLIERSAVCPLCKMDLYEAEEEEEEEDRPLVSGRQGAVQTMTSWFSSSRGRSPATSNAVPVFSLPWLSRPGAGAAPRPTTTAPTPPPAQAFRWGAPTSPSTNEEGQEQTAPVATSSSPLAAAWAASGRWFARHRRRGTEGGSMLTELTEPLMAAAGSGDVEAPATTTTTTSQAPAISDETPATVEPPQASEAASSTAVEI